MFGFGKPKTSKDPKFIVGSSTLFIKNQLTPFEYGLEVVRLSFSFALAQLQAYRGVDDHSQTDTVLLTTVSRNPGPMQLLYVDLVAGGFLCHARMVLRIEESISAEVEAGILAALRAKMEGLDELTISSHSDITANFAVAIEREMTGIERDSTVSLLKKYIIHYYPNSGLTAESELPSALNSFIVGLGTRFVAVCQRDFRITFQ
jgi:hypothetical protein